MPPDLKLFLISAWGQMAKTQAGRKIHTDGGRGPSQISKHFRFLQSVSQLSSLSACLVLNQRQADARAASWR